MLSDYQGLVNSMFSLDATLASSGERDAAIVRAVHQYSADRPQSLYQILLVAAVDELPLPAYWESKVSRLIEIEYPLGRKPPHLMCLDEWYVYQSAGADVIKHIHSPLVIGESAQVAYTASHVLSDAVDTIPLVHRDAVAGLAAALLCDTLSVRFAGDTDATIQADSVQHGTKSGAYAKRAAELRKRYTAAVGVQLDRQVPLSVHVDWDALTTTGDDRFYHPGRWR